uniref:Uncharacterized protein n=1 Tax=Solanum tuberosum TaxID=4113 RepID=M1DT91_SOLTU
MTSYSFSVLSPEGENQVGERKKQSADHRVVLQCSVRSPKVTDLEDAEGQGKKTMELTKGQITELIGANRRVVERVGDHDFVRHLDPTLTGGLVKLGENNLDMPPSKRARGVAINEAIENPLKKEKTTPPSGGTRKGKTPVSEVPKHNSNKGRKLIDS